MKLEILFRDKNFEDQIAETKIPEGVSCQIKDQAGLFSVIYEINQNNTFDCELDCTRRLSYIRDQFIGKVEDYYIAIDEASEFYNFTLYPKFNAFERNLRKLIYCIAIKSGDREMFRFADSMSSSDFYSMMSGLFNNKDKLRPVKQRERDNSFVKQMTVMEINSLQKKSLWSYFVTQDSYLANNWKQLVTYRDRVMHAGNMSHKYFIEAFSAIEEASHEVDQLLLKIPNMEIYLTAPQQEFINQIIKTWLSAEGKN